MKFKTAYLFYLLTIISFALLVLTRQSTTDIAVHDTYFIISYTFYFVPIIVLSLSTAFIYSLMDKKGKPIKTKTGIIHFSLILLGLFFSLNIYRVIMMVLMTGSPDTTAIAFEIGLVIFTFGGPVLLLFGLIVFVFGLIKAMRTTTNAY